MAILAAALTAITTVGHAQDSMLAMTPAERTYVFAVCDRLAARFIQESISTNGKTVLWTLELKQSIHGIPVVVAVVAYPTAEQIAAADLAART